MWAFITEIEESDDGEILSCILLDICYKKYKSFYLDKHMKGQVKFRCVRTTFNGPGTGVIE